MSESKYFERFRFLVEEKGGKVISNPNEYINSHHKLKVICSENHNFEICLNNIKKNRWCPLCSTRKMERYTKAIIEKLTNKKFIKIRPSWLKNKENNLLEIDIYNEELKLGIEYNGKQHYEFVPYFHEKIDRFNKQVEDDKIKIETCIINNINLIVVPYTCTDIKQFIINKLDNLKINYNDFTEKIILKSEINERIDNIVKENNGFLLTTDFVYQNDEIELKCQHNHIWKTKVNKILSGSWCHTCGLKVDEDTKIKISEKMKLYLQSDEGKKNKIESLKKRSETMKLLKEERMNNITFKDCKGECGRTNLEIINFNKKASSSDGYQPWCKKCTSDYKRKVKTKQMDL